MASHSECCVVTWIDLGRDPKHPAHAMYPKGIDVDLTEGREPFCHGPLPYPAPRVGRHVIECNRCGLRTVITAAGRSDDPRSFKVPCKREAVAAA